MTIDANRFVGMVEVTIIVAVPVKGQTPTAAREMLDDKIKNQDWDLNNSDLISTGDAWIQSEDDGWIRQW